MTYFNLEDNLVPKKRVQCQICGKWRKQRNSTVVNDIEGSILEILRKHYPSINRFGYVCIDDLDAFQTRYMSEIIENEASQYSSLQVITFFLKNDLKLSGTSDQEFSGTRTR